MAMGFTIFGIVSLCVALLVAAVRTGPVEAKLNLSSWAENLHLKWLRRKEVAIALAIFGSALLLVAFMPKLIASRADGIIWLSESFQETGYGFLSMTREPDEQYRVIAFTALGENRTGHDINDISGFVRSDITNQTFELFCNIEGRRVPVADIVNIPDGQRFTLEAPFGPPEGIPSPKFLTEIGGVTFVFVHDGEEYQHDFTVTEIRAFIQKMDTASGYKPSSRIITK
jgi:hypothetical protein